MKQLPHVPFALAAVLAALVACPLVAGCGATTRKLPAERVVLADNEPVFWQALCAVIAEENYALGGGANPSTRRIRTGWKLDLAPFKGHGFRTRVHATYTPEPTGPDDELEGFDVSIRVEKETNESFRSSDPTYAKWVPADDDFETARRLLQQLRAYIGVEDIDVTRTRRPGEID